MDNPDQDQLPSDEKKDRPPPRPSLSTVVFLLALSAVTVGMMISLSRAPSRTRIGFSFLLEQIRAKNVLEAQVTGTEVFGQFKDPPPLPPEFGEDGKPKPPETDKEGKPKKCERLFLAEAPPNVNENAEWNRLLTESGVKFTYGRPVDVTSWLMVFSLLISIGLFAFFFYWLRRSQNQMMGGGFLSGFTRSPAKRYEGAKQAVTFADVAGLDGVKADLLEIVEFLKSPGKFQKLGGRVPKGVLLNGPPGTGKTLLARAVAGEAGVPFFSVNGSEFIQMFVGVGASRVRDLFRTAKESSPAIIFIDEIDAVGRQRGAGLGGGHDEREQTLNQILSEMDGFSQNDFVIVLAATNRPDVLDPALLRPGRFDRHVTVGRPTQKGRIEIFKVHTREVPLADDVNLETLASGTIGLTGADIRNIVNEAALWAARQNKTRVDMSDFEHARDKVLMGPKREEVLLEREKEKTAYHEAGHTLLAWTLKGASRVHKVTIVPRGRALGVTHLLPSEDRLSVSEPELRDHLAFMLGGRAAEKLMYNETSVGAENDLERATGLARKMVMNWGMSEKLGPVSYKMSEDDPFLGREMHQQRLFSERTMQTIDEEVSRILRESSDRALALLTQDRRNLEKLSAALIEKEELDESEIALILGPSIHMPQNGHPGKIATSVPGSAAAAPIVKPGG